MSTENWFEDLPVLGKLPPEEAAAKLREVGEESAAIVIEKASKGFSSTSVTFSGTFWGEQNFTHTSHTFGYIAPITSTGHEICIQHISNVTPNLNLKNSTVKVTLNGLSAVNYPGSGTHRILLTFGT